MIEELGMSISRNWTTQEQILPLSLEMFEINPNLIDAPKTLRDLAIQYKNKKNILDKKEQELDKPKENSKFQLFLNSFLANVIIFTAALITLIIILITGGSRLSRTAVKLDSRIAQIFVAKFFCIIKLTIITG